MKTKKAYYTTYISLSGLILALAFQACNLDGKQSVNDQKPDNEIVVIPSDSLLLEYWDFNKVHDDSSFSDTLYFGNKMVEYSSIPKELFMDKLRNHHKELRFFEEKTKFNENLSKEVIRKGDTLIIWGNDGGVSNQFIDKKGEIQYLYTGKNNRFHIIQIKEFENWYTALYEIGSFDKVEKEFPPISISNKSGNLLFATEMHSAYVDPKGRLTFYSIKDSITRAFDFIATNENNWCVSLPFFVEDKKIYYLHRTFTKNGESKEAAYFAQMELKDSPTPHEKFPLPERLLPPLN